MHIFCNYFCVKCMKLMFFAFWIFEIQKIQNYEKIFFNDVDGFNPVCCL